MKANNTDHACNDRDLVGRKLKQMIMVKNIFKLIHFDGRKWWMVETPSCIEYGTQYSTHSYNRCWGKKVNMMFVQVCTVIYRVHVPLYLLEENINGHHESTTHTR